VKRHLLLVVCCGLACLVTGLAYGETTDMHKYYGPGPYVSPPYWKVPDLTAESVGEPPSALDLTHKGRNESAYPDLSTRYGAKLQGKRIGRPQPLVYPLKYTDHSKSIINLTATRQRTSVKALLYGPSSVAAQSRYPSYRTFEFSRNYGNGMQRYMQRSAARQPR